MDFKLQLVFLGVFLTLCMGEIIQEGEITDENGHVILVAQETSEDCSYRRYTSVIGDNVHVIVDDFSNDISVVLFSENHDVCYIRNLTDEEEEDARNCVNGTIALKKEAPETQETLYDFGEELDLQTLPTKVQKLCGNRKAIALDAIRITHGDADQPKKKRQCRVVMTIYRSLICRTVCPFWLCRLFCSIVLRPLTRTVC